MEEEPQKRRAHPPVLDDGLLHHHPHGVLQAGAGPGVESRRELRVRNGGEERDGEQAVYQRRTSHGDQVRFVICAASSVHSRELGSKNLDFVYLWLFRCPPGVEIICKQLIIR